MGGDSFRNGWYFEMLFFSTSLFLSLSSRPRKPFLCQSESSIPKHPQISTVTTYRTASMDSGSQVLKTDRPVLERVFFFPLLVMSELKYD